ncbi:MAG TPA: glucose-6-phosphate dehydrogenase [Acidimicrobiia bacterium]
MTAAAESEAGERVALSAALVVFGATGDLAHRKLYPALGSLASRGRLPARLTLVGNSRREMSDDDYAESVRGAIEKAGDATAREALDRHGVHFRFVPGSAIDPHTYTRLRQVLKESDDVHGNAGNVLYYLATAPAVFGTIATRLGEAGLAEEPAGTFRRVVVEKPFGRDLASAEQLDEELHRAFQEHQVYRIDHYLAKETVQNILALRFTNTIFEPLWNRRYVDRVEITVAEQIGVEHRGAFYEQAGALRDIVQNHVMQVLALTAMEAPASFDADAIRDEKVKLLRSVRPLDPREIPERVVRGQYGAGSVDGADVRAYREEVDVSPESDVETYLAMRLDVDNWRWAGVPFYVRAGKRLRERTTQVSLRYKPVPFLPLPPSAVDSIEPNIMCLHIQPDEGISLTFAAKVPGGPFRVRTVPLAFSYRDTFEEPAPEAYERVLLDAFLGDATLFIRGDEVDVAWRLVQPVLDAFEHGTLPLAEYPAGSWGPREAEVLLGGTWCEVTP